MKYQEKIQAINLRKKGYSMNHIASQLGISKSSVSLWVRDVQLSDKQLEILTANQFSTLAIEHRRQSRLKNELEKRDKIIQAAQKEIKTISRRDLWMIGIALYWAEGGKTQRMVRYSNGDPKNIMVMMRFFRDICNIKTERFRGYIHIHSHLDHKKAEQYWSNLTGIPLSQFYKTYRRDIEQPNKKNTLPNGVMDIYIQDINLFLNIKGWINGVYEKSK